MNLFIVATSLILLTGFLLLKPWIKVLVALIVMSNGFDIAPQILYGKLTWDYGAILMMIAATQLAFKKKSVPVTSYPATFWLLASFSGWLILSILYSLVIYGYPLEHTLKTARYWIIGYLTIFIIVRLYLVDPDSLGKMIRWLYAITYVLLIVSVIQLLVGSPLLFGLHQQYAGTTRYLPIFLPICLMFNWFIMSRFLSGEKIKPHEHAYVVLAILVTSLTYTRGIYIATILTFLLMFTLISLDGKIKIGKTSLFGFASIVLVIALASGGLADRVASRAASGFGILFSDNTANTKANVDTFTGRLRLVQERFSMVARHNLFFGYGFLHEAHMPDKMRKDLKFGSIDYSPEMVEKYRYGHPYKLTLYSADIAWGNIVLVGGLVGFAIFITFVAVFLLSYRRKPRVLGFDYFLRLAFYLQTINILLLTFNGNSFTYHIQIPAFMLAGYIFLTMNRGDHTKVTGLSEPQKEAYTCLRKSQS